MFIPCSSYCSSFSCSSILPLFLPFCTQLLRQERDREQCELRERASEQHIGKQHVELEQALARCSLLDGVRAELSSLQGKRSHEDDARRELDAQLREVESELALKVAKQSELLRHCERLSAQLASLSAHNMLLQNKVNGTLGFGVLEFSLLISYVCIIFRYFSQERW